MLPVYLRNGVPYVWLVLFGCFARFVCCKLAIFKSSYGVSGIGPMRTSETEIAISSVSHWVKIAIPSKTAAYRNSVPPAHLVCWFCGLWIELQGRETNMLQYGARSPASFPLARPAWHVVGVGAGPPWLCPQGYHFSYPSELCERQHVWQKASVVVACTPAGLYL